MMISLLVVSLAYASADSPPPSYKEPSYPAAPASYSFSWAVKDDYSKNDFGQDESRAGDKTTGSYYVALPDGRTQKVSYSVDAYGGKQHKNVFNFL